MPVFSETTIPFGRYNGRTLGQVARADVLYLQHLIEQEWFERNYRSLFAKVSAFLADIDVEGRLETEVAE
jgi:uncharacterized protein (DUF3820 family)